MKFNKTFTLSEARAMIPQLRKALEDANIELESFVDQLEEASLEHQRLETVLGSFKTDDEETALELRKLRAQFQQSIERLATLQQKYVESMSMWADAITDMGVMLRDLSTGLLDFPAEKGSFTYLLCWRLSDPDIEYWHLPEDGFRGRRPLAVLEEYF